MADMLSVVNTLSMRKVRQNRPLRNQLRRGKRNVIQQKVSAAGTGERKRAGAASMGRRCRCINDRWVNRCLGNETTR